MPRKVDRSSFQGENLEIFKAAIRSPVTRDVYERRLLNFLGHIKMTPEDFLSIAKNSPGTAEKTIISFDFELKERNEKGEIAAGTVHNCVKCVRLLLEMNDIFLNWRKISRILPRVRRYALDRIPTTEEIREILDASDVRSKALTLVLLSSGIREGAIEILRIRDYMPIKRNGAIVAGRIIVYSGEPEKYLAFITFEAAAPLEKSIEYRKEHGEDNNSKSLGTPTLGQTLYSSFDDLLDPPKRLKTQEINPLCFLGETNKRLSKNGSVIQKVLNVLPHAAESAATFTPLAPFSKLIGKGMQEMVNAI